MKALPALAWLLFAFVAPAFAQDNVLRNGDFSSGPNEWQGDIHTAGAVDSGLAVPASSVGVELRAEWTKVTQDFEAPRGKFTVTVSYSLSPGTTFSTEEKDYRNVPDHLGFSALKAFPVRWGDWVIIVAGVAKRKFEYAAVHPANGATGPQTVTTEIRLRAPEKTKTFCLAFPPGHGFITLQGISLVPR